MNFFVIFILKSTGFFEGFENADKSFFYYIPIDFLVNKIKIILFYVNSLKCMSN